MMRILGLGSPAPSTSTVATVATADTNEATQTHPTPSNTLNPNNQGHNQQVALNRRIVQNAEALPYKIVLFLLQTNEPAPSASFAATETRIATMVPASTSASTSTSTGGNAGEGEGQGAGLGPLDSLLRAHRLQLCAHLNHLHMDEVPDPLAMALLEQDSRVMWEIATAVALVLGLAPPEANAVAVPTMGVEDPVQAMPVVPMFQDRTTRGNGDEDGERVMGAMNEVCATTFGSGWDDGKVTGKRLRGSDEMATAAVAGRAEHSVYHVDESVSA